MKIGIYFETSNVAGGAHHQNIRLINIFAKHFSEKYDFTYIVTNQDLETKIKKLDQKCILIKKTFITRIEQFLLRFNFFKEIYKKLKIVSRFESFLNKQKFELIFFNAPYESSLSIIKKDFVMNLLSMQHKTLSFFPEYKGGHDYETRDYIIKNAVDKSFRVFVGTKRDQDELINFYNSPVEKIVIQPYATNLPYIYEKNKKVDFKTLFENLNIPSNKKLFIYPAQFWAHKNHRYIIDAAIELKKSNINDIFFVFCGSDKGNLNFIKSLILKNQLNDFFKILDYIDDNALISLYLNCSGVVMPTFVGHSTIPMYEAFYFKKNIFYTKGLADDNLKKYISEIDIKNPKSFKNKFLEVSSNSNNLTKLEEAKNFYLTKCSEEVIVRNFQIVFEDFKSYNKTWSNKIN